MIVIRTPYAGGARRTGCLGVLLLPFALAHRIFRPGRPDRITDPWIEVAQMARTAIGVAATLWLLYAYPLQGSVAGFVQDKALEMVLSAAILLIAGPTALAVFVLSARRPVRVVYCRRALGPLAGFGAMFGTSAVLWFLVMGGAVRLTAVLGGLQVVGLLVSTAGVLFGVPFAITAVVLCVHYCFRLGDVSEILPPVLSPALVWSLFAFEVFDAPPVIVPAVVRGLFLLGPPLSVTCLSVWELRLLRVRYGITVRQALGRSHACAAS
ncbi:hypothetical protein ABZ502_17630 [Streptomyces abikoensis]|uniref:hypothetical protein n=1 Tax=Streptomyces abikoensis TaxID=97398 RepID=UPI0033E39620